MMEKTSYVQKKYIKKDTVEIRDYQKHLAMYAKDKNTMVVLPTGLGKTVVALHIIADHLENINALPFRFETALSVLLFSSALYLFLVPHVPVPLQVQSQDHSQRAPLSLFQVFSWIFHRISKTV